MRLSVLALGLLRPLALQMLALLTLGLLALTLALGSLWRAVSRLRRRGLRGMRHGLRRKVQPLGRVLLGRRGLRGERISVLGHAAIPSCGAGCSIVVTRACPTPLCLVLSLTELTL